MKKYHHLLLAVVMVIASSITVFSRYSYAASVNKDKKTAKHVLIVHDGEKSIGVLTDKNTVGEALKEADIDLQAQDVSEPNVAHVLTESNYDVNIYRARPIAIRDGSYQTRIMSPYRTAKQIAKQAQLDLYDEDVATIAYSDDIVRDGALERLTITRATTFIYDSFGKANKVRTQAKSVGEYLKSQGITALKNDEGSSHPMNAPITTGMTLRVWRDGKQQITVEEAIAKPLREEKDATKERTFREVKKPGTDGKKLVTYDIELRNGQEISRKEVASQTTLEPVEEVITVGSKSRIVEYTGGGSKSDWLRASGIPEAQWGYVDAIVTRESGWNPNSRNKSSGACGLAQALPCEKVPGNPYDPVDSLKWMNGYVNRYGGWEGAYNFWQGHHWY